MQSNSTRMSCLSIVLTSGLSVAAAAAAEAQPGKGKPVPVPITIHDDGGIAVRVGESRKVMNGVQPFLYSDGDGVLLVQAQTHLKPHGNRRRINHFPWRFGNRVSRDFGVSWEEWIIRPDEDPPFLEGGGLKRDGAMMTLDTYITPTGKPDEGEGDLWISRDGWRSFDEPTPIRFHIPGVDFDATADDGGHAHRAIRLHRSLIELPGGDLLATAYGAFKADRIPSAYQAKMMKLRSLLFRSSDGGKDWNLVSTIAVGDVGSEGFNEPVLCRLSNGPHVGRLICLMRTGRDLHQAVSDDEGATWSEAKPVAFSGIDIHDTERWRQYLDTKDAWVRGYPVASGAVVDPDLVELENGILACAIGVRIPEKACFRDPTCPRNGNYLAFSRDGGKTWSHVIQLTSGVWTTHYMSIREIRPNELFVTYDLGFWGRPDNRVMGCTVNVSAAK